MSQDYGALVNLLSHKLKKQMDARLAAYGITGVQAKVMRYIGARYRTGPVFQRDVEEAFDLSRSTATGILQLLEKNGFLLRESTQQDARLKSLVPTQKAEELEHQIRLCIQDIETALTKGLSPGQLQLFAEVTAQMSQNLDNCTK
jgi:DNA-binding MarR family transcriptional regulator